MKLDVLADQLRQQSGLLAKRDIQAAAQVLDHLPFPELGNAGMQESCLDGQETCPIPVVVLPVCAGAEGMMEGTASEVGDAG